MTLVDAALVAMQWIQEAAKPSCQHEWMRPTEVDGKIVVMCFKCGRVSAGVEQEKS